MRGLEDQLRQCNTDLAIERNSLATCNRQLGEAQAEIEACNTRVQEMREAMQALSMELDETKTQLNTCSAEKEQVIKPTFHLIVIIMVYFYTTSVWKICNTTFTTCVVT